MIPQKTKCFFSLFETLFILNNLLLEKGILDSGRNYIWSFFRNDYIIDFSYLGKGIGFVDTKLKYIGNKSFGLFHNDILKIYIEMNNALTTNKVFNVSRSKSFDWCKRCVKVFS